MTTEHRDRLVARKIRLEVLLGKRGILSPAEDAQLRREHAAICMQILADFWSGEAA